MIFEKKHYVTPGILKSLLSHSFFGITGPWGKLRKDCAVTDERIGGLSQNKIPILSEPKALPIQCFSCHKCVDVCPTQCLDLVKNDTSHVRSFKINLLNCISCSKCAEICLEKLLVMTNVGLGPATAESEWTLELIGFAPEQTVDKAV
ncbi:MAG: hypothetical protein A2X86_18865 [Bdellovibrionales bacterium GWA2_49_15]|nr:MAG: hypothetical protein A2X86_18865 [Bdellovibrionales bacterium GWA2_49_15]HAZ14289.1 hypothetical protein [Bdellovibrionales bacterium]